MKLKDGEALVLDVAGAQVSLNAAMITEMFIERLSEGARVMEVRVVSGSLDPLASERPPAIGKQWKDGVYAGIARGVDGQPDHHLVVLEQAPGEIKWQAAVNFALERGGVLPSRRELALCYANVPELFERTWYWSGEQYAGNESYAWCQLFGSGYQGDDRKGSELRARAVRRLTL